MCQGKICPAHLFLARAVSIAMPVIHQWYPLYWMSLWFGNRQKLIISGVGNNCYCLYLCKLFGLVCKNLWSLHHLLSTLSPNVCICTSSVGAWLLRCPLEIHGPVCKLDLLAWLMSRHSQSSYYASKHKHFCDAMPELFPVCAFFKMYTEFCIERMVII